MNERLSFAFVIYSGFTALDVIGPYEILRNIPGADSFFVAESRGLVINDGGELSVEAEKSFEEVSSADVVVIGGGLEGTLAAMKNATLLNWLRAIHETTRVTFSVCTGSLILGAAGLLDNQPTCTHWAAKDLLQDLGSSYCEARYHRQGKILTAAGVSAGIDAALQLAAELTDQPTAEAIQLATEYDPKPPFNAGSPRTAPARVVEAAVARLKAALELKPVSSPSGVPARTP